MWFSGRCVSVGYIHITVACRYEEEFGCETCKGIRNGTLSYSKMKGVSMERNRFSVPSTYNVDRLRLTDLDDWMHSDKV